MSNASLSYPGFTLPCFTCERREPMEEFVAEISRQLGEIQNGMGHMNAKLDGAIDRIDALAAGRKDDAPAIATAKWMRTAIFGIVTLGGLLTGPVGGWLLIEWIKKHWP